MDSDDEFNELNVVIDEEDEELLEQIMLFLLFDGLEGGPAGAETKWVVIPIDVNAFRRLGDPAFQLHFRMSRTTFEELLGFVGRHVRENNIVQRARTPLDLKLMHALWILATPDSFRSVALQFGVHPGTIHRHYVFIISVLCSLAPQFITWPSADERQRISNAFEHYSGFPGIVGCIDGTYVTVTAPTIQPRRYIDRHHQYSLNVQAVCDHRLLVRDLYVGEAGSMTDARVFRRSPLSRQLLTNPQIIDPEQHIIGDGIYMLTDKLLTPHRNNGYLGRDKRRYNYLLCKCRARIEHCFGKLFSQWRRLKFMHSFDFELTVEAIVSCFVLQNFMILSGYEEEVDIDDEMNRILLMMKEMTSWRPCSRESSTCWTRNS